MIRERIHDILSPVLSDRSIIKYNKKGLLIEQPIKPSQLQPNSVDLTLGTTWKKILPNDKTEDGTRFINPKKEMKHREGKFTTLISDARVEYGPVYVIKPGEFVLMACNEVLNIPNGIISFVQGRSSVARIGIQTEEAGLIDAGFRGTITFEVCNEADYPIMLVAGMRIAQVHFFKAQHALAPYGTKDKGSKYQSQISATGSQIYKDPELSGRRYI